MKSQGITTKKLVLAGLLAALTVVGSALRITLPLSVAGTTSFHLGNIFCALSGILLGPWLGGLAAGLGSALYDILFYPAYISECWITFLTKGAYAVAVGLVIGANWNYGKAMLATLTGAMTYAVLYLVKSYFWNGLLVSGLTPATAMVTVIEKLPATIFNIVVALVIAPLLAVSLRKALQKSHLSF